MVKAATKVQGLFRKRQSKKKSPKSHTPKPKRESVHIPSYYQPKKEKKLHSPKSPKRKVKHDKDAHVEVFRKNLHEQVKNVHQPSEILVDGGKRSRSHSRSRSGGKRSRSNSSKKRK